MRQYIDLKWLLCGIIAFAAIGCGDELQQEHCEIGDDDGTTVVQCPDGTQYTVEDAVDGRDGAAGEDGTSCTVDDSPPDGVFIECEDGTEGFVAHGEDGQDGDDGSSCSVEDNGDGTYELSCDDGTSVLISDGQDGQDGQDGEDGFDCDLQEDDGDYTLHCEGGIEIPIGGGSEGTTCSVEDNGDGTGTMSCTGSPSMTFDIVSDDAQLEIFANYCDADDDDVVHCEAIIENTGSDDFTDNFDVEFYEGSDDDPPTDPGGADTEVTVDDGLDAGEAVLVRSTYPSSNAGTTYVWTAISADGDLLDVLEPPARFSISPF